MIDALRARLTYANVTSTVCLFVLLGGTSYAAVTLKKNSVGSSHIRNGQVRSVDVKDRSLLVRDFAAGQLPAGAKGDQGPAGRDGVTGPAGPAGPGGANGPSGANGRSFVWRGAWSSGASYSRDDAVSHTGSTWIAERANSSSTPGPASADWDLMASKGDQGGQGAQGVQGVPGTTGQSASTVFGTSPLSVTPASALANIPGLEQSITVPASSKTFVATGGGMTLSSATAGAYSVVNIGLQIDNTILSNGFFRRIHCGNVAAVSTTCTWSISGALTLSPGSHTIRVVADGAAGTSDASVSGSNTTLNQGELSVMFL